MLKHDIMIVEDRVLFPEDLDTRLDAIVHERFLQIAQVHGVSAELDQRIIFWKKHLNMTGEDHLALDAFSGFNAFCKCPFDLNSPETFDRNAWNNTMYGSSDQSFEREIHADIDAWGGVREKILALIGRPAWRFMDNQNTYYSDYHYNTEGGPENHLCIISRKYRPAVHTALTICRHLFVTNVPDKNFCADHPNDDFYEPHTVLDILNRHHLDVPVSFSSALFVTKDVPSQAWSDTGIRQIVLAPGGGIQKTPTFTIAGSFEDILSMTTEPVEGEEKGAYVAPGIEPLDPSLN